MKERAFSLTAFFVTGLNLIFLAAFLFLLVLGIRALTKYLRTAPVRKEREEFQKTLGETIKEKRLQCRMTQEFVAEHLGVSRQAVSKWESGLSSPSTANLMALARLFDIAPESLLRGAGEK